MSIPKPTLKTVFIPSKNVSPSSAKATYNGVNTAHNPNRKITINIQTRLNVLVGNIGFKKLEKKNYSTIPGC